MSSLSKFMKLVVFAAVSIFVVAFISGCINTKSVDYSGQWVGYGKTGFPKEMDCVYDVNIEKTGDGYTVSLERSNWELKDIPEPGLIDSSVNQDNQQYEWTTMKEMNLKATEKDNTLTTTTENPLTFTYQEKDGVLELSFKDYSHQNEQVTVQLHKAVKGEVEDFKNRSKEDLIKSMTPENRHSFKE